MAHRRQGLNRRHPPLAKADTASPARPFMEPTETCSSAGHSDPSFSMPNSASTRAVSLSGFRSPAVASSMILSPTSSVTRSSEPMASWSLTHTASKAHCMTRICSGSKAKLREAGLGIFGAGDYGAAPPRHSRSAQKCDGHEELKWGTTRVPL
jgi:hypothetical protein